MLAAPARCRSERIGRGRRPELATRGDGQSAGSGAGIAPLQRQSAPGSPFSNPL